MASEEKPPYTFLAFRSVTEGRPIHRWFNPLPEEDREEIVDLLDSLQKVQDRRWPKEVFDPLKGAEGISEIKIPNLKRFRDGKFKIITYRIYGFFGPYNSCYTFLHAAEKDVKNDRIGKQIAEGRLEELRREFPGGTVSVYKFEYEEEPHPQDEEGARRTN